MTRRTRNILLLMALVGLIVIFFVFFWKMFVGFAIFVAVLFICYKLWFSDKISKWFT